MKPLSVGLVVLALANSRGATAGVPVATTTAALATASGAQAPDPCVGQLDAATVGDVQCRSPGALDPAAVATADAIPPPVAPLRDPTIFPGELGFAAVVAAVAGGGAIAGALFTEGTTTDTTSETIRQGSLWGGVSLVSLSGGLAAAALSTWVFNVATGEMSLPIFADEPR